MRFLVTVLVLAGLLLAPIATPAVAQSGGEYTSPTYGFTVQWDPDVWNELSDQALVANGPDDLDRAVIRSGDASLYLEGATRYAGDAQACVTAEVDVLGKDPQVTSATPAEEFTSGDANRATGAARFDLEFDDGSTVTLIGYVDCQLISDDAVFIASVIAPETFFDNQFSLAKDVIDSAAPEGAPEETPEAEATAPAAATPEAGESIPAETFSSVRDQAIAAPPTAGPLTGDLAAQLDSIAKLNSDLDVADFFASAVFTNPYAASENPFDIGFGLRDAGGDDQLRLIVDSDGNWYVMEGAGSLVFSGPIDTFNPGAGETNMLDLVVIGDTGYFAVNNQFVSDFDTSSHPAAGGFWAGAGFFATDIQPDSKTNVADFLIWSLDAGSPGTPVPSGDGSTPEIGAAQVDDATISDWVALAKTQPALTGPRNGSVQATEDGPGLVSAGVDVADALVQVRWANPGTGAENTGIMLRTQPEGDPFIRLSMNTDGTWIAVSSNEPELASGPAPSLKTDPGAINTLSLVIVGSSAGFTVNGEFVGSFDTGDLSASGDVWFGAGFGDEPVAGEAVNFRDFSVWSLDGFEEAPAGRDATPAPAPVTTPEPTATPDATAPVDVPPAEPTAEPTAEPEVLPTEVPPVNPANNGSGNVRAIAINAVGDSGISGLATITTVNGSAALNLVLQGLNGGELVVIQEGTCEELSPDPAFLLNPFDAGGRSKTTLGVSPDELAAQAYAVVVHPSIEGFSETLACGNVN